jgi:hypothetical protein
MGVGGSAGDKPPGQGFLTLRSPPGAPGLRRIPGAAPCWVAVVALLGVGLAGCGLTSEQTAGLFFSSPGKFNMYSCAQIEANILATRARHTELEQLMARASQEAGGAVISAVAYRTEYAQARDDLKQLARAKEEKQCAADSKLSSGRAVF